jgi:hypothetical protein
MLAALFALGLLTAAPLSADEAPPVLEITGNIAKKDGPAVFDVESLKELGVVDVVTSTPWTEGKVNFVAVPGDKLIEAIGAQGTTVAATALDGYTVDIPIEDFKSGAAIIAVEMNGEPLPADKFGPFWVIYRYDDDPALADEVHQARSIWQLKSLQVK